MDSAVVEAAGLRVRRGTAEVLRGLDFSIGAGRVTGLIGPSGCGKTTLMRAIVGLQVTSGGALSVLGRPAGSASLRPRIGYAPQDMSIYRDLTVAENVGYFAACIGAPADDVGRVIEQVDLAPYTGRVVERMSGGQRSRVSLAVALLGEPDLLVFDEPTVGLDPLLRRQLWDLFAELVAGGVSLVVSSHVMDEAERCADILLMREGELLAHESPQSLKERTSCQSLDDAFLALVTASESAP